MSNEENIKKGIDPFPEFVVSNVVSKVGEFAHKYKIKKSAEEIIKAIAIQAKTEAAKFEDQFPTKSQTNYGPEPQVHGSEPQIYHYGGYVGYVDANDSNPSKNLENISNTNDNKAKCITLQEACELLEDCLGVICYNLNGSIIDFPNVCFTRDPENCFLRIFSPDEEYCFMEKNNLFPMIEDNGLILIDENGHRARILLLESMQIQEG